MRALEAAGRIPDGEAPGAAHKLYSHLAAIPGASLLHKALLDDQDGMTSRMLARLLKSGAEALLRDPRSPAVLAAWRASVQGPPEAESLATLRKRVLEALLEQLRAADVADWGEVAMRLGVPDPGSCFAEVPREVRAALRSAQDFGPLWGSLVDAVLAAADAERVEGLAVEIRAAAGIHSAEDQWVLDIKRLGASSPTPPGRVQLPPVLPCPVLHTVCPLESCVGLGERVCGRSVEGGTPCGPAGRGAVG